MPAAPMQVAPPARCRAALVAVSLVLVLLASTVWRSAPSDAAPSPATGPAAAWLADLVGSDGSVENPFSPGTPSVVWTVNVALALAAAGTEPEALEATMGYIEGEVEGYVVDGTDNAGRLGYLILLAEATGRDPYAFGTGASDLVARLQALHGEVEPGLFDDPNDFASATYQALAILALHAVGETVPADAVSWLVDQQCLAGEGPAGVEGGWQGYRSPDAGGLVDCEVGDGATSFQSPDSNNTAVAVQALASVGALGELEADPATFFLSVQGDSGAAAGGFAFNLIDPTTVDPNSTAVAIQALLARGDALSSWAAGGGDPMSSLESWVIGSGADAGALASPSSGGAADTFATYQGVWGLAEQPFPFDVPDPVPPTPTTTTSTTSTTTTSGGDTSGGTSPVVVEPRFTG